MSMKENHWISVILMGFALSIAATKSYAVSSSLLPLTPQTQANPIQAATDLPIVNNRAIPTISAMLLNTMPAVVNVTVMGEARRNYMPQSKNERRQAPAPQNQATPPYSRQFMEVASGVIVDAKNGYLVTNAHVVADAKVVTISLSDGRRFKAKIIGSDKLSDIALLQIKADNLTALPWGDSDALKVGDFVAAIGNPFGLQQTVTSGIISALHRSDLGIEGYENFIQTDASINPGNSGGALVSLKGELIGINTALIGPVAANVGIGLSIPSNMVKEVISQLIKFGKVERGVLGVLVQNLTPALADAFNIQGKKGALVTNITPGSPADKAGIKPQDVIEMLNNTVITSGDQLRNMVGLMTVGTKVNLMIHRKDKTYRVNAEIISPKTLKMATEPALASFLDGVRLTTFDELVPDFGPIKGVGVIDVDEMSDAWISGLRPGDVILEANGQPVSSVDTLLEATLANNKRLLLKVGRDDGIIFLVINNFG